MFRILPITILFLAAFVAYKTYLQARESDIVKDGFNENPERVELEASPADLQQIEPAAGGEAAKAEPAKEEAISEEKPEAEGGKKELPDYVSREKPEEYGVGISCDTPDRCKLMMNKLPASDQLLLQMTERRQELDKWKEDLDLRASLLEASSRKLDDKIAQLEELKKTTQALLDEYKIEDDKQISSMVKVYENMKPKEAAKVFDQLQMPILLEIVQKMNERRLSPILAKMNAKRAKELTEKIIENRDLTQMSQK